MLASRVTAPAPALGRELLDLVGNTPLVRLDRLAPDLPGSSVLAKAEFLNPGGSVKDRPAASMIRVAECKGALRPGQIIMDATSGNTGIAYAMIGAALGYRVLLYLPASASEERKRILAAYGAEVVLTDAGLQTDGAIEACKADFASSPAGRFYPDQYGNPANWMAHYETTGPEIWAQTRGRVTHFVAGLGTSGTLMGTGRYLRERNPAVSLVSMQPATGFHGIEGLKHMATALQPGIYDPGLADQEQFVDTEDAYAMVRRMARATGLMVGISSGANVVAALRVARAAPGSVVVTVMCDGADKYLTERFWDEEE